jgi:tetratricopeptide (TPR) repeat protein
VINSDSRMRERLFNCLLVVALLFDAALPIARAMPYTPPVESPKLATQALKRGERLLAEWNLNAADVALREAAALGPATLDAELGLVRVARARLDYLQAITLLNKAAVEHPNSVNVLTEFGAVYLAAEEPGRARRYFETALELSARDASAIIGLAGADLLERDYDRAARSLRAFLTREPKNSHAHARLARVLLEGGRNAEAAEEAQRAVNLDADNAEALHTLACIRSSERKADEARSLARRAVSIDPFNIGARRLLSQYLDGQAGYEQTVSEQARIHYDRGRILKQKGEIEKGIVEFEQALRIQPHYYRALIGVGDGWLRQGDYQRAADAAKLAIAVDSEGAAAHLELSCAYRGESERARIEIGAVDFAGAFYGRIAAPAFAATREIFPGYAALSKRHQAVIDMAVAPLAAFLPKLVRHRARHYLLALDERPGDLLGFGDVADEKTFDGRYYASIRGVGGRVTVSGIEYLDQAARGGFNTIAHEFAHQVHIAALGKTEVKTIRKLYERARQEGRTLDYYAAANEYEYFAQGYEAFVSDRKRPSAGVTARHTGNELLSRDPELYKFLLKLCGKQHAPER